MKGDIILIGEEHRRAGRQIAEMITGAVKATDKKFVITVAGESGAGKSELAHGIAEALEKENWRCTIFQQDDYYVYPPRTNAEKRKEDIGWVGPQEVKLDLIDRNLQDAMDHLPVTKPLVDFRANAIGEETVDLNEYKVLIIEGTYVSLLKNVNCRVFIDRNKLDTAEARKKRNREVQDDFLEQVLTIEHEIISKHKAMADIVVSKEFEAGRVVK